MTVTAADSSVLVAGLLDWHESHGPSLDALVAARAGGRRRLAVPAPALVEACAVLTRMPSPHRLSPADAIDLLSGSLEGSASVVSLTERETWRFLHDGARRSIAGGRTYDALILACARKAGATRLLTLDRRDFARLDTTGIELVVPLSRE